MLLPPSSFATATHRRGRGHVSPTRSDTSNIELRRLLLAAPTNEEWDRQATNSRLEIEHSISTHPDFARYTTIDITRAVFRSIDTK